MRRYKRIASYSVTAYWNLMLLVTRHFLPHSKYEVEDWFYVFIYLIWVGLCPSCGYADGQIWFKCSDDEVWENMIYFFFSHLNQSSKTHCCDKWKVFVFIAWSTEYSVHWSWMLFPYCNCFLACNDASCPYPPCPLPSVSDAFGQIDRLHFSR